jgi:hypothetical protein
MWDVFKVTCASAVCPLELPGLAAALEELDGPLVLLGGAARCEGAEILTTLGARIDLARI